MARYYIKAYFDWIEQTAALSDAERGRLFIAVLEYARSGLEPNLSGREAILFPAFKSQLDRDGKKAATSAGNGRKGGRPKTYENLNEPNETYENLNEPVIYKKIGKEENRKTEKEEEKNNAREAAPPPMPYGLTDADITASIERDRMLEQTARECGLPTAPANMMTARDLADEHTTDTLIAAMRRAADGKSQTWGYVKGILRRWKEQGGIDAPQRKSPDHRPAAANYTQRDYTDAQLNAGTDDLLREAMEVSA